MVNKNRLAIRSILYGGRRCGARFWGRRASIDLATEVMFVYLFRK